MDATIVLKEKIYSFNTTTKKPSLLPILGNYLISFIKIDVL